MNPEPIAISTAGVSGLVIAPPNPWAAYVLAHGAGAGMRHPFMATIADLLAERGIATLRYQFPYMEHGGGRPDPPEVARGTVRAAVAAARERFGPLPVFAGGKSFGGRMTSQAESDQPLGVRGLAFLGFPLHPPNKPGVARAEHLDLVRVPMLFLQGTRDELADLDLIRQVGTRLGAGSTIHVVEGADHSFAVLKRSGRTNPEAMVELAETLAGWARPLA